MLQGKLNKTVFSKSRGKPPLLRGASTIYSAYLGTGIDLDDGLGEADCFPN